MAAFDRLFPQKLLVIVHASPAIASAFTRARNKKGLQTHGLQAFMIGAQERTRTSTPLSAST